MNTSEFTYLLHNPSTLNKDQVSYVAAIIEEFPYFQSARAMYLKGLKDLGGDAVEYQLQLRSPIRNSIAVHSAALPFVAAHSLVVGSVAVLSTCSTL